MENSLPLSLPYQTKTGKQQTVFLYTCLFMTVLRKSIEITTILQNFSRSTQPEFEGVLSPSTINQKCRIMSKWVQFYHKLNKFDLVNMRFTDEEETVEMVGMDSVMRIDGRWNMPSIRAAIQKKIERMKNFDDFDPCAFSILTGSSILNASESPVYNI